MNEAIEKLNYEPNYDARALRSGTTRAIGFLVRDILTPAFAEYAMAIQQTLHSHGYTLILRCSLATGESDSEALETFRARRVDGVILSTRSEHDTETLKAIESLKVPVVFLDREPSTPGSMAVKANHAEGVEAATRFLIERGHREIAHITGNETLWPTRSRLAGFQRAFKAAGVDYPEHLVRASDYTSEHGRVATRALFAEGHRPTAILAAGAQVLIGVLEEKHNLVNQGIRELEVVACDAPRLVSVLEPRLSAVHRDERKMGELAAKALLLELDALERASVEEYLVDENVLMVPTTFEDHSSKIERSPW